MTAPALRLLHPRTGEPVDWFDPAVHQSPCWLGVTCTRCGRSYVCSPWDDFMTPNPAYGHAGEVCEPCLYALAAERAPR